MTCILGKSCFLGFTEFRTDITQKYALSEHPVLLLRTITGYEIESKI